jgi:hypothetical protein
LTVAPALRSEGVYWVGEPSPTKPGFLLGRIQTAKRHCGTPINPRRLKCFAVGLSGLTEYNIGMKPVVTKFQTFQEADVAEREFYRRLSPAERLEILFQLRAMAHKESDATSGRLARVYRIAQLKQR